MVSQFLNFPKYSNFPMALAVIYGFQKRKNCRVWIPKKKHIFQELLELPGGWVEESRAKLAAGNSDLADDGDRSLSDG